MFCQVCGLENIQGLNFCKRCGAVLNPNALSNQTRGGSPFVSALFLFTLCVITVVGLVIPVIAATELHDKFDQRALAAFMVFALAAIVCIDGLLINLFTRYLGLAKSQLKPPPVQAARPRYDTGEARQAQLPEPPFSVPSVTEHTTRNFEPVADKRSRETS